MISTKILSNDSINIENNKKCFSSNQHKVIYTKYWFDLFKRSEAIKTIKGIILFKAFFISV